MKRALALILAGLALLTYPILAQYFAGKTRCRPHGPTPPGWRK